MSNYTLEEVNISPDSLILDPRNPRIIENPDEYICSENSDYSQDWVQDETLKSLKKGKFNVSKLQTSIEANGFLNIDSIFVKQYDDTHYIVLEGNRRTAAVKQLLRSERVSEELKKGLCSIPVKVLHVSDGYDEDEIITTLLSIRHLDGPLEWEPMQRAFVVYETYMRQFNKESNHDSFKYIPAIAKKVATLINSTDAEVKRKVAVVRIFRQLQTEEHGATSSHYSIIEKTLSYPKLCQTVYEYDSNKFQFSYTGCNSFSDLCLTDDRPINDPKKVRKLHLLVKNNRLDLVKKLENGTISLQDADDIMEQSVNKNKFFTSLVKVDKALDLIRPYDYQGTAEEKLLFQEIQDKVNKKLGAVVAMSLEDS